MAEIITGLYDDLFEFDDIPQKPPAPDAAHSSTGAGVVADQSVSVTGPQAARAESPLPSSKQSPPPLRETARYPHPQRVPAETGERQSVEKVKYFIMKSNNSTNIDRSLASGVWSTQHHNEAKLNKAFLDGFAVRLVFSINQSGHFQGYAVMKSAIGRGPKHNIWVGSAWGGFFEIDWQLQYDFPFSRFEHLSNPLNEGKPVKFARDGQEIPAEIGNEVVRVMHDIARANGVTKPVIPNQLRVEPYPAGSLLEGRSGPSDRRDYHFQRERSVGRGRGHGYRWGDGYGRYAGGYGQYAYPPSTPFSFSSRWHDSSFYDSPYSSRYGRQGYGSWGRSGMEDATYDPALGCKRPRSPSLAHAAVKKRSLYEMTYNEYLECYDRVQARIQEIIRTGELWKALGMIREDYEWTEADQKRITESGWLSAWFGDFLDGTLTSKAAARDDVAEVESSSGSRVMTDTE